MGWITGSFLGRHADNGDGSRRFFMDLIHGFSSHAVESHNSLPHLPSVQHPMPGRLPMRCALDARLGRR